ncbi:hypothetical protein [Microcoleus sp. B3-A4]|uniref:hypothetical protein n=1 Tax=Microcoleus sp. B3-A4 TaxID=2818653 RepID=UPI002FD428E0
MAIALWDLTWEGRSSFRTKRPIALSEKKGDRPLRFDMGKAIALFVVRAIALFSNRR